MRSLIVIICILITVQSLIAQDQEVNLTPSIDSLIIDQRVTELINKHIDYNVLRKGMEGYRVQIYFDSGNNSKETAFQLRTDFMTKYPGINAYVVWQQPNYKVRVGDFITKIEAQGLLDQVKLEYKNAFIVKDVIDYKVKE